MKRLILTIALILLPISLFSYPVNLRWDRNVEPDVTGYNVYRGTVSGTYAKINTTLIPQPPTGMIPSYSDNTPQNINYFYVVRAVNQSGLESPNSNEVMSNGTAPHAPTNLQIVGGTVSLSIDDVMVASTTIVQTPQFLKYNYILAPIRPPRQTSRILTITVDQ